MVPEWKSWLKIKNFKIVPKNNKIISKDEADFLGDCIGNMREGKLICCQSSIFLRYKFGAEYNLTMVKENFNV